MIEPLESAVISTSLWFERFAELLGCDARPESISVKIQDLQAELVRAVESIPLQRAKIIQDTEDRTVMAMHRQAVNCGMSSTCAVAGWWAESIEKRKKTEKGIMQ